MLSPNQVRRVFSSFDAFGSPFQPGITSRLLLHPADGLALTETQFESVAAAVAPSGTALRLLPDRGRPRPRPACLQTPSSTRSRSTRTVRTPALCDAGHLILENVVMSDSADRGVFDSQEFHALVGGPAPLVERFKAAYGRADTDPAAFIRAWEGNAERLRSDDSCMPGLLRHLRGS